MNYEPNIGFNQYLSRLQSDWQIRYPELEQHLTIGELLETEWLPHEVGSSYFVLDGILGKYQKKSPLRYVLPLEPILIAVDSNSVRFKALTPVTLYKLNQQKLYELHQLYPSIIQLNHRSWLDHHKYLEYRSTLLEYPKAERLEIFRKDFQAVIPLITRKELAQYLNLSEEYLRRLF